MNNELSSGSEPLSDITERIAALSPAKRALLELRLKKNRSNGAAAQPIPHRTNRDSAPLSFAQQRLWFLDQLEPNSPLYNVAKAVRLSGPLNVNALRKSLAAIVERHEALRTTFSSVDGEPVQVIHKSRSVELTTIDLESRSVELTTIDLGARSNGNRNLDVQLLLQEEARRPFNLSADLMLRPTLFRLAEEEHILLLVMHHIASDGWSMGVLFRELAAFYEAFSHGKPAPLPELPIQYADFAVWQRHYLQGEVLESQLSYWKKQLAGAPALLDLAPDRPRPAVQSYRGAAESFVLPESLSEALKVLSRREGVTLYMALLAAFNVLLSRYSGQEDLVVGSPIAGRNHPEVESLIGFFVNTLVLRIDLSGNVSFKELLGRARKVTLEAFTHQDLPFEKLVEALHPKRDASHRSLVQIAFAFQNVPRQPLEMADLTVRPLQADLGIAKTDLTLFMWEAGAALAGTLNYNVDLYDSATISRMLEHLQEFTGGRRHRSRTATQRRCRHRFKPAPFRKERPDSYDQSNLTQNQLLIWAEQKLYPDVPLYNVAITHTLKGDIDRDHFKKAFQTLVNSSDALRTVIREIDGIPDQIVLRDFPYELEYLDFSKLSNSRAAFDSWLEIRSRASFDLEQGSSTAFWQKSPTGNLSGIGISTISSPMDGPII